MIVDANDISRWTRLSLYLSNLYLVGLFAFVDNVEKNCYVIWNNSFDKVIFNTPKPKNPIATLPELRRNFAHNGIDCFERGHLGGFGRCR